MMFYVNFSTEGRLAHQRRFFAIFWSILATSSIRHTFSRHSFTPELLRNEGTEMGQSNQLLDGVVHTEELTDLAKDESFDTNKETMLQSNHNAIFGSPDQKKETSYLWQQNLFKYDCHSFGKDLDPWGKKVSNLEPKDTVKAAQTELSRFERGLEISQYKLINIGTDAKTAYDVLVEIAERAKSFPEVSIGGKKLEEHVSTSSGAKVPFDTWWNAMAAHFETKFKQVIDLLLKSKVKGDGDGSNATLRDTKYLSKPLISQTFNLMNIFLKYTILEEHSIKAWLNDDSDLLYALSRQIYQLCSPPTFLGPDLQEILSKSSIGVDLGFVLNLLDEKSWSYIEGQYLNMRYAYIVHQYQINSGGRFSVIRQEFATVFSAHNVALQQGHFEGNGLNVNAERGELIRSIISYIKYPQRVPCSEWNLAKYGYLYELLRFIMRYHTDQIYKALCEEYSPSMFSKDVKVMEAAISWLKSAREISFMAKSLWTTDIDAKQSTHLIKLQEVHDNSFHSGVDLSHFEKRFGIYVTNDETRWQDSFRVLADLKQEELGKPVININLKYGDKDIPKYFGTNFAIGNQGKTVLSEGEELTTGGKQISRVLLSDVHDWLERLKILHKNFREDRSLFLKLTCTESAQSELAMINQAKNEINKSSILQVIFHEISQKSSDAQYYWNRVETRLQQLNREIFILDMSSKGKQALKIERQSSDDSTGTQNIVGLPFLSNGQKPGDKEESSHQKYSENNLRNDPKSGLGIPIFNFEQDSKLID